MFKRSKKTFAVGRMKSGTMNNTEAAYAQLLDLMITQGKIAWYKFEGITLKLADMTRYTPDFIVMLDNGEIEIHEVKGSLSFIQDDAKVKIKVAADIFPFRFIIVAPRAKKHGGGWETKEIGV